MSRPLLEPEAWTAVASLAGAFFLRAQSGVDGKSIQFHHRSAAVLADERAVQHACSHFEQVPFDPHAQVMFGWQVGLAVVTIPIMWPLSHVSSFFAAMTVVNEWSEQKSSRTLERRAFHRFRETCSVLFPTGRDPEAFSLATLHVLLTRKLAPQEVVAFRKVIETHIKEEEHARAVAENMLDARTLDFAEGCTRREHWVPPRLSGLVDNSAIEEERMVRSSVKNAARLLRRAAQFGRAAARRAPC